MRCSATRSPTVNGSAISSGSGVQAFRGKSVRSSTQRGAECCSASHGRAVGLPAAPGRPVARTCTTVPIIRLDKGSQFGICPMQPRGHLLCLRRRFT
jgi:hypothetical protein